MNISRSCPLNPGNSCGPKCAWYTGPQIPSATAKVKCVMHDIAAHLKAIKGDVDKISRKG